MWREPTMFNRCPTIGHSSCRNTFLRLRHTPRQCRAHRVVVENHAAGNVRAMLRIADARASTIRAIDAHVVDQVRVPLRTPPASKHHNARECVWQRALGRGVGIVTGCFRAKRKSEGNRAGMPAWARTRVVRSAGRSAFRPLKTKRPRRASEGVRVPRRSGRPISREEDQSAVKPLSNRAAPYPARHRPHSRRSRDIGLFCWWMAGFIRRAVVVMWKGCIAVVLRWARTLRASFFECKHFFYIRRRVVEVARAAAKGKTTKRPKPLRRFAAGWRGYAIKAAARDRPHGSRRSSGARRRSRPWRCCPSRR